MTIQFCLDSAWLHLVEEWVRSETSRPLDKTPKPVRSEKAASSAVAGRGLLAQSLPESSRFLTERVKAEAASELYSTSQEADASVQCTLKSETSYCND